MTSTSKTVDEIYISVDVEADGAIPGPYSMTALGAAVAGYRTVAGEYVSVDPEQVDAKFYAQLKPISDKWELNAIRVGVLDGWDNATLDPDGSRKHQFLVDNGAEPEDVMNFFNEWVLRNVEFYDAQIAVFMGYPVVYDWMWVYWYLMSFCKAGSPFNHGRSVDIKTAYAMKANRSVLTSSKRYIPIALHSKLPHTHRADDDAAEQGQLGMNSFRLGQA